MPLPVRKIPGVGKATEKVLTEMGIATVGDLHRFTAEQLVARFGKWGTRLWELARGIDESPVVPSQKRKSWSSENTFAKDITLDEVADVHPRGSAETVGGARAKAMVGRTVTVKLRTGDFKTATRRLTPGGDPVERRRPRAHRRRAARPLRLSGRTRVPAGGHRRVELYRRGGGR